MMIFNVFSGYEVIIQVTVQALILLIGRTQTSTTGGFETIFEQDTLGMHPDNAFILSITWSIFSCVTTHTKLIAAEKGFCPMTSKIFVFLWGTFAIIRRIFGLIALFIPSMGLFNLLHHWKYEQIPFRIRLEYAKRFPIKPDDKIALYGLNETIYWSELDRWDYSNQVNPEPPHYSRYTLLSLKYTFITLLVFSMVHFLAIYTIKYFTSNDFNQEQHRTNKIIHVLENINFSTPFKDWDHGDFSVNEFRKRYLNLKKEMIATFTLNFFFTIIMMVPLWFCGMYIFINNTESKNNFPFSVTDN